VSTDPHLPPGGDGRYYVIVDVDIHDTARYTAYMERVRPALEDAGGRYLVRGGAQTRYEGRWTPARLVLLEFPSKQAWESFYFGAAYENIRPIRDETSTAHMIGVEGMPATGR
jgi:uncharacterized protein (DUF1330 family)